MLIYDPWWTRHLSGTEEPIRTRHRPDKVVLIGIRTAYIPNQIATCEHTTIALLSRWQLVFDF